MPTEIIWMPPAAAILLGYLLGSIPFGVLLTRMAGAGDLRQIGSGNIGATNVLRTGRKGLAAATLLLDLAKGAAAVLLAERLFPGNGVLAGLGCVFRPLLPGLAAASRAAKGVATLMGIVVALHWPSGLVMPAIWLGLLAALRISSLAGITAAIRRAGQRRLLGAHRSGLAVPRAGAGRAVEAPRQYRPGCIRVRAVTRAAIRRVGQGESTAVVAARVAAARGAQLERLAANPLAEQRRGSRRALTTGCMRLDSGRDPATWSARWSAGTLTVRGYHRVLRVAWTLADLGGLRGADPGRGRGRPSSCAHQGPVAA